MLKSPCMQNLTIIGALALLLIGAAFADDSACIIESWQQRQENADIVLYAYLDSVEEADEAGQYSLTFTVLEVAKGNAPETIVLTTRMPAWINAPVREWLDESRQIANADVFILMLQSGQTKLGKCDPLTRIMREG